MLTCICSSSKQNEKPEAEKPLVKTLTAQVKGMAVKASGAYKSCKPCIGSSGRKGHCEYSDSEDAYSEKIHCSYTRNCGDADSNRKTWGKEMESRLKGISLSSGERTPVSSRADSVIFMEEDQPKEWVAHVEPGVLITFVSLLEGGNELKKIRFSRDMFNKWQAQRWWTENFEKVVELYNVRKFNQPTVPLQTPQKSENEITNNESVSSAPSTPSLSNEPLLHTMIHSKGAEKSSSDSLNDCTAKSYQSYDPNGLVSTPMVSNIIQASTETSSVDVSARSSSSYETDHSGQLSVSNASELESEWVEQDEPGVYITICELPGGIRELRRVRFSREKFGEVHARLWWEENRARILEQYL